MKTYRDLFIKICTIENFQMAYQDAIKGKTYYSEVIEIEKNRDAYLKALLEEVKSKKYKVSEYTVFNLFTGHKMREIFKLPMKDRIVQHAIMRYCEPIFRETFILDTYASIKTRGIHLGLQRVKKALKKHHYRYCLKLDIHKCYPSLDKEILKKKLARKFVDPDLLDLLFKIVDSCEKGVPIGNYTSQYFNNFYFSDFDHWIKETKGIKAYFRYCDDMVILSNSKEELHALLGEIMRKIKELNVSLKENYQLFPISSRGLSFLGYIITEDCIKVRKHTKKNFVHKVSKMIFFNPSAKDVNVLGSYWGILSHANCRHLWKSYLGCSTFKAFMKRYKCSAKDILNKHIKVLKAYKKYSSGKWYTILEAIVDNLYTTIRTTSKYLAVALNTLLPFDTYIIATQRGYRFNTNVT